MDRPVRLTDAEIAHALATLPRWTRVGDAITKRFTFADFPRAVAFVTELVPIAEAMGHHPDLDIRYNTVIVALSTHDAAGITEHDVVLARVIEGMAP